MTPCVVGQFTQTDPTPLGAGSIYEAAYVYAGDMPTVMTDPGGKRGAFARLVKNPIASRSSKPRLGNATSENVEPTLVIDYSFLDGNEANFAVSANAGSASVGTIEGFFVLSPGQQFVPVTPVLVFSAWSGLLHHPCPPGGLVDLELVFEVNDPMVLPTASDTVLCPALKPEARRAGRIDAPVATRRRRQGTPLTVPRRPVLEPVPSPGVVF